MKRTVITLLFFLWVPQLWSKVFTSLSDAKAYVAKQEEYPDIDNTDWLNPDFGSFHKRQRPGVWNRFLTRVKIKRPEWTVRDFKYQLEHVIEERELNGLTGRFVQKINPLPGSKIFIWGDLHGALHSLVRDLTFLLHRGIIDDNFKIKGNNYFVFGNVIDRSPYSLETLSLIFRLLAQNPDKVFYIIGDHEDKQKWHGYGLARELQIRARHFSSEKIPFNQSLTRFFNTLPIALYITEGTEDKKIQAVRISYIGRMVNELDENKLAPFLATITEKPTIFKFDQKLESETKVNLRALIKSEDRTTSYQKTKGLIQLEEELGVTVWAVLSSPIGAHRRLYEFFNDVFAEVTILPTMGEWTITSFYQDVRQMLGFKKGSIYNLVTGRAIEKEAEVIDPLTGIRQDLQEVEEKLEKLEEEVEHVKTTLNVLKEAPKVIEKEEAMPPKKVVPPAEKVPEKAPPEKIASPEKKIERPKELVFGSTLDLSKGAKIASKRVKSGVQLRLETLQDEGGIDGMDLKVVFRDDEYTPHKARANIEQFLKDGIDMTLCSMGSPTLEAYLDLVKEGKVLVVFPSTGAPIFRKPELKYIIHFRVCYCTEARVLVEYAYKKLQVKKFAVFYQNDVYGLGALGGARNVRKELNIDDKSWIEISYERNDVNFAMQAKKIEEARPDAILFLSTSIAAEEFIRQIGVSGLAGKKLLGLSDFAENVFRKFAKKKGLEFTIVSVVPNPATSQLAIVQEFRKKAESSNVPIDTFALEGYVSASILIDLLKKISGPITKDTIIAEVEKIKKYDFKGLLLNFNEASRELSNYLWLYTGQSEWERIVANYD